MTNSELAIRLRKLADLYDANPDAAQPHDLSQDRRELVFCHNKRTTAATIKAFGPGTKDDSEYNGTIVYKPHAFPEIEIHIFKSNVCERVKVGEREVPETVIPARPAQAEVVIPARTEEIFEWRCGALLAPSPDSQETPNA